MVPRNWDAEPDNYFEPTPRSAKEYLNSCEENLVIQDTEQSEMKTFSSGAKSTVEKPRYDLIPPRAMELLAERFAYGASRHGERNYRKGAGDAAFIRDRINHLIEHCMKFAEFRRPSDLAAILCNGAILADIKADTGEEE